ncbi:MAG TPA: AsmA-like C-terminal region-containing protein, partial [Hyphomicrobiales bacterium]|nr:AsmA-like C-terminal region-containing protein [Hyphomicrobiales bacterium]
GVISPMPVSFLKAIWPAFIANGCRDWIGSNIPAGKITGGSFSVNLTAAALDALSRDGDIPDSAVSVKLGLSGLQIYHIKGLPPIITKDTVARMHGRHFIYDVTGEARIEVPSGRPISFYDGQFIIDDLRPHFPIAEVHFKGAGEVAGVLELLDQPSLGYVRAVGFKPNLINGQASSSFKITFPLLKELKFKQMGLSGKTRVTDLKSNGLPGGLAINGGAVNFDVSETAISANGELKVNNVPVSLVWQRIFDAPPERQPTLRVAAILNEKARDEFGLNINHIVKGDLPVALAVAMQRDGPPKLFMEANLTNTDVFLTAIGWRKPPGQKATVSFDIAQRQDNFIVLDNFVMTGDGLNIGGRLVFNDKRRIAAFAFPEFSTNVLTKLAITGELTPQNILKVQAKGPSYDGRQFFRSLLLGGKTSDDQPAPLKDEPGLDLNVEIDTVFGFYDTTVKSVIIDAKRRDGKLSYLELAGRINGEAPMAVHVDQRHAGTRLLVSDATDAGSVFRLVGFYPAIQGGTMNLRVNLDGSGGVSKAGILDVRNFRITGDQVVGRVVSQAERETARHKQDRRNGGQPAPDDPLVFDRMTVPFSIAGNQFHLHNAAINGPFIGATLKGDIDFSRDTIALSGTYVPFYGANAVFKAVPVLGDILTGGDNEGVFGMTFAIQGRTANPDVVVNPIAMLAPGFLRQIFEFQTAPAQSWPAEGSQAPAAQVRGKPRTTAD